MKKITVSGLFKQKREEYTKSVAKIKILKKEYSKRTDHSKSLKEELRALKPQCREIPPRDPEFDASMENFTLSREKQVSFAMDNEFDQSVVINYNSILQQMNKEHTEIEFKKEKAEKELEKKKKEVKEYVLSHKKKLDVLKERGAKKRKEIESMEEKKESLNNHIKLLLSKRKRIEHDIIAVEKVGGKNEVCLKQVPLKLVGKVCASSLCEFAVNELNGMRCDMCSEWFHVKRPVKLKRRGDRRCGFVNTGGNALPKCYGCFFDKK